jgi:hypothetical protein
MPPGPKWPHATNGADLPTFSASLHNLCFEKLRLEAFFRQRWHSHHYWLPLTGK